MNGRKLSRRTALALLVTSPVAANGVVPSPHSDFTTQILRDLKTCARAPQGMFTGRDPAYAPVTYVYKASGDWIRLVPVPYTDKLVEE